MDTILVTGGAGFIGSHVCKALSQSGRKFIVYDNLERGNRAAVQWCDLVVGDLSDKNLLKETIERNSVKSVIHFAALAYVRESILYPNMYWQNNVSGTKNLLDVMTETGVRHIVFSSSCASYGIPKNIPIHIDSSQNPITPYGRTKLVCEWMIQDYARQHEWSYAILRYFNVTGNDPDLDIGEVHEPETHIVPILLLNSLNSRQEPVPIFGGDLPTADGTCVRDFIHVADLASVHVKALEYIAATNVSAVFNVGLGKGTSVLKLLKICEEVTKRRIPHKMENPNPGDPPSLIAHPGKVWTALNLSPRYAEIKTMIEHTWQWMLHKRPAWIKSRQQSVNSGSNY